jgi:hypothetical protein
MLMMNNNYYGSPYYSYNSNNYQSQPQQVVQQQYLPLAVVNSKEDIERFIVQPNGAVFLYSEQLKLLCIKRADNIGRFSYETYNLNKEDNSPVKYALLTDFQELSNKVNEIYKKLEGGSNEQ